MSYPECRTCGYKSSAAKHLNETELQTLEFGCAEVLFKKGEVVFREGTLATNTIYLKRGMVKVHMKGPSGDKILKLIKAPTYLGLPTTFGDRINQYSATAISDAEVCFISLDTFKDFITKNGDFAYELIMDLCRNELVEYRRCTSMSQKQIPGRVAEVLLCMSDDLFCSSTFEMPLNNSELADLISTSRETVNRQLSEFIREGLISMTKRKIQILDAKRLGQISING
ncbi:MAG: Crp/Fnr family transcriptional regulator [Bacteroidales bacterium]|jgi:CRP/FNR family transcriptional regulator|nr:Crp/Fnr family transcriptional regulator [Bacteroidales bacterium]HOA09770.1 Crp/Fnr family transcriptional regulator [Tenuifilaceae bacterium]NLI87210.1 Crp/Fnr family transcriptional regulator [Bacteroidales bacterium]HOC35731.1 Crp/Fnr family transcriptional regulator [Tenuifilaceae bacterium]HOG71719.1 Crp/Fnr family transcriptional regulator [Tenuifilaceae bacterium]